MAVSNDFQFSQASLQDFQDCRRRFFLRYVQRLAWPALESEPALENEKWLQQGSDFHHMVHQYLLGVPAEKLSEMISSENLSIWWENFLSFQPFTPSQKLFPERLLATKITDYTIVAKFDLVVVDEEGRLVIYDWKTSRYPGSRSYLSSRLQTRVYPYVLAKAGNVFVSGEEIIPEKIKMIYWHTGRPTEPEVFNYSLEKMLKDLQDLNLLIEEIIPLKRIAEFPMTEDRKQCRFCVYRSLCDRGQQAGSFDELEYEINTGMESSLDFDQIPEIEF